MPLYIAQESHYSFEWQQQMRASKSRCIVACKGPPIIPVHDERLSRLLLLRVRSDKIYNQIVVLEDLWTTTYY